MGLFRFNKKHTPQAECGPFQRVSVAVKWGMVSFYISWVISYVIEWEDYSNYFGEGAEISRIRATAHSLVF